MSRLILPMIKALVGEGMRRTERDQELSLGDKGKQRARAGKRGKKQRYRDGTSEFRK